MLMRNRMFYFLCLAALVLMLLSTESGARWTNQAIFVYVSSRWVHFIVFLLLVATAVASWTQRKSVLIVLAVVFLCAFAETSLALFSTIVRAENSVGDIFGAFSGILLGLNVRVMRSSLASIRNDEIRLARNSNKQPVRSELLIPYEERNSSISA